MLEYLMAAAAAAAAAAAVYLLIHFAFFFFLPRHQHAMLPPRHKQLQFTGVDSVLTADLGEGKERAKEKRKSLNKRCDALRDRILKAGEALKRILATTSP
jgi:hypothetical protein